MSAIGGPTLRFATAGGGGSLLNLALDGVTGCDYRIETSTNLQNWLPLTNFLSTAQSMNFQDTPNSNNKFYRAVMEK